MTREEELNIIYRIIGGESELFETLVLENQTAVYNLALKMTKNEQDALDISQEAFIKAYSNLGGFRGESKFSVWLYRLTYNLCLDFLRKQKRFPVSSITYIDEDGESRDIDIPDIGSSPAEQLEHEETRRLIDEAVCLLPDDQRQVFVMREYSGMAYDDIAESLSISIGTVKSRLSRARQKIVRHLLSGGTFSGNIRHNSGRGEKE